MHDDLLSGASGLPAALSAFLRGVERRAYVFLWLQDGNAAGAERALAAAIRAFPGPAAAMPMAEWPARFWRLLAALPAQAGGGVWPDGLETLATLPWPARRALLLRQVAGLDEAAAAAALGMDGSAYEALLAQACPRAPDGAPDAAGWRAQAEAIQQAGRGLATPQLLRLAQLREAALAARPVVPAAPAWEAPDRSAAAAGDSRPDRRGAAGGRGWSAWRLAALAALLLLGAVAAAWWLSSRPAAVAPAAVAPAQEEDFRVHDNDPVAVEPLPDAGPAAAATGWPSALAEAPAIDPVVADLALLSWYAAGAPASRIEHEGKAAGTAAPASPASAVADETSGQEDWMRLDGSEQAGVRAAAVALAADTPQAQAELRARFAALDTMERRGWRLGPALGADYAVLQPLIGFVAGEERVPLLDALRALTPEQRAQLGELALRTPPTARASLRHELLAQPPASRGDWLAARARQ